MTESAKPRLSARGSGVRADRPRLTRERIVAAALALIDRHGVGGLSMRKLGAELAVDPMAIYYYLPNKSALFDAVVEAVYAELDVTSITWTGDWREELAAVMHRFRDTLRRHPRALPIVATRPTTAPVSMAIFERALELLEDVGFSAQEVLDIINCLGAFTIGHALAEVGEPVGGETPDAGLSLDPTYADQYPRLARALAAGIDYDPDESYALGLSAMISSFRPRRRRR
ncbi:MAG: TetR/AcrR family transcriptional regulator [Micromonosporaceae bacterium]|nr:TetR/AcrR family transcriptional regulator [Micromonosporaceae bacterium]